MSDSQTPPAPIPVNLTVNTYHGNWTPGFYIQPLGITNSDGSAPGTSDVVGGVAFAAIASNTGTNVSPIDGSMLDWPVDKYPYLLTISAGTVGSGEVPVIADGVVALNFAVTVTATPPEGVTADPTQSITVPPAPPAAS